MKRSSEVSDLQGSRERKARRQEPVSCFSCRKKKLKCDRVYPACSNCRARKLDCSFASDIITQAPSTALAANSESASQQIDDLNTRLIKLEALLATKDSSDSQSLDSSKLPERPISAEHEIQTTDIELKRAVSWLETDTFEHQASPPDDTHKTEITSKVAEGFGSLIFALTRPRVPTSLNMHVVANLPARGQGEALLEFFFEEILWIYHIIHVPTVRRILDKLYTDIESHQTPDYGYLALISTTFALSAYFASDTSGLFFGRSEGASLCHKWTVLAQEALSAANGLANPTIETLQSMIFISQLLMPNLGAIATLKTLSATITHTARAIGLHQVDSNANKKRRENSQVNWAELEVKRRLWWHICSTDWILSFMSGSQCGTYAISPKQMTVDCPSNCDDSEIGSHSEYAAPLDKPTEMTFIIYRCRGSTVFRDIVDAAWDCGCAGVEELPFELVLSFDKKLNSLVDEVDKKYENLISAYPQYFDQSVQNQQDFNQKIVLLARQRQMAHFGVHTRFSRLHRPYLVRGAQDPRYAYSRMVCLRSARQVIEIGKNVMNSNKRIDSLKIWSINHHIFVSLTILVMDYCFNRQEPRAKERKEEIMECFRLLEDGEHEHESTIATRGLQKLKDILRDGAKSQQRTPEREAPKGSAEHQQVKQTPRIHPTEHNGMIQQASFNLFEASHPQPPQPLPQFQWSTDFDYSSLDNINFDVDLDASQFDVLFQNIEDIKMF